MDTPRTTQVTLRLGDCLEILPTLDAGSIDAIITDLPYGTTACDWDTVIPLAPMWEQVKRVLKPSGIFVTTACQPFTSILICSNLAWFKYEWIWEKSRKTGFLDCSNRPLRAHENIEIFYSESPTYNPQMRKGKNHSRGGASPTQVYGSFIDRRTTGNDLFYPDTTLYFPVEQIPVHPTQKPVALYEYLIRTYTNPGDTVLDIAAGSGTTGVAAIHTGRNFIGIEKGPKYYAIMERRVSEAQLQEPLFVETPPAPRQDALV
jgi:site-specific DNA-methyltransferase (adenine-specific)